MSPGSYHGSSSLLLSPSARASNCLQGLRPREAPSKEPGRQRADRRAARSPEAGVRGRPRRAAGVMSEDFLLRLNSLGVNPCMSQSKRLPSTREDWEPTLLMNAGKRRRSAFAKEEEFESFSRTLGQPVGLPSW